MHAIARAHGAARWLLVLASAAFFTAAAAINSEPAPETATAARANEPFVVALAMLSPVSVPAPAAPVPDAVVSAVNMHPPTSIVPSLSTPPPSLARLQARFFTINEVMARQGTRPQQLASVSPAITPTSITSDSNGHPPSARGKGDEPFGLFSFVAPDGQLWAKWRKVADEIRAEEPALARCFADSKQCSPSAARFSAIVKEAREQNGRARLDLVNRRVNEAIRYRSDVAQWGVADLWSPPLAADGTGSFNTGLGDCEDFAIAKYVALRASGVASGQLRVMLVHDNIARMDHAVLAALEDGHWYILDNRWTILAEDSEVRQFVPLYALDDQGVKLLAAPYASKYAPMSEGVESGKQIFMPGGEAAGRLSASSPGPTGVRSAPVLL